MTPGQIVALTIQCLSHGQSWKTKGLVSSFISILLFFAMAHSLIIFFSSFYFEFPTNFHLEILLFSKTYIPFFCLYESGFWVSKYCFYRNFRDKFPYFKPDDDKWKNSVRHNLSISPHFRKSTKSGKGAGHLWTLAIPGSKLTGAWVSYDMVGRTIHFCKALKLGSEEGEIPNKCEFEKKRKKLHKNWQNLRISSLHSTYFLSNENSKKKNIAYNLLDYQT